MQQPLLDECSRIEEYSRANAAVHYTEASMLNRWIVWLDVIPAAAIAGVGCIAVAFPEAFRNTIAAQIYGLVSIVSAGLATAYLKWSPNTRRDEHLRAGALYKNLENRARRARDVESSLESDEAFHVHVAALGMTYDDLNHVAPQPSDKAFERAMKKVHAGIYDPDNPDRPIR